MHAEELATYRTRLTRMRTALLAQIAQQRGGVISRAEAAADHFGTPEDSAAQVATARDLEFALGERELEEVGAIDAALQRIESGGYGACVRCGVQVPQGRLQATPEAARCISCQNAVEQQRA